MSAKLLQEGVSTTPTLHEKLGTAVTFAPVPPICQIIIRPATEGRGHFSKTLGIFQGLTFRKKCNFWTTGGCLGSILFLG